MVAAMTSIVGVAQTPETLPIDAPVEVAFESVSEAISLPKFRLTGGAK